MSLSPRVSEALLEAEGCLRNALHHASRSESPQVITSIAKVLQMVQSIEKEQKLADSISGLLKNDRKKGHNDDIGGLFL